MGQFDLYPNITTLAALDEFILWQNSAAAVKNITFADLASEVLNEKTITGVWHAEVSATSGTVSAPAGGTLIADGFSSNVDALCSTITTTQNPDLVAPETAGGVPVTVSSFTVGTGAFTLSGTPSAYPVDVIFAYTSPLGDYDNTKNLAALVVDDGSDVTAAAALTDDKLVKGGTASKAVQTTGIGISDADEMTAVVMKQYNESIFNITTPGATETIDLANGGIQRITADAATVTLTLPTIPTTATETASLVLILEPATNAFAWAASPPVEWLTSDGAAPTLVTAANLVNVVTFIADTYEGTDRWLGFLGGTETA